MRNKGMTGPFQWQIQGRGLRGRGPGGGGGGGGPAGPAPPPPPPPHLFLDQTEAWRAKKNFFWVQAPPFLRVSMTAPPPPLTEGLDPPLLLQTQQNTSIVQEKKISRQA